jgi:hypothetical protein
MNLLKEYTTEIILTFLTMGISWIAKSIYSQSKAMEELLKINRIQTETIACHTKVTRNIIRALRSHSYALKEAGANGSTERALEHIGHAEDDLNSCLEWNSKCAMSKEVVA